jgi:alkylhydroperoxidase family enzyme
MARVPYVNREDLPEHLQHLPRSASNITRALSNSPYVAHHSGVIAHYFRDESPLDARLRELAILQVGYSTRCAYEFYHHVKAALDAGVSEGDILAIAAETAGRGSALEPLAKAALRAAREMTDGLSVTASTFAELKRGLDDRSIVELIFAIANYNGVVRMLESLEVELEPEYSVYLGRFPLPS